MRIDTTAKKALSSPQTRRAATKYQLDLMGLTMCDVARSAGVVRNAVYRVFDFSYPRMEKHLSSYFGMTAQEMFPERHHADGSRIRKKPGPKPKKTVTKHIKNKKPRNIQPAAADEQRRAA